MKIGVDMVESLSYKIQMFEVLVYGSDNVLCNNKAIYNNAITMESILKNNHHSIP